MLVTLNKQLEKISAVQFQDFELFAAGSMRQQHPGIDFFIDYWEQLNSLGTTHPRKSDIKPQLLKRHLPHFVLLDVENETEPSLRVRLIGTHVAKFYGEITGQLIDEMPNAGAVRRIKTMAKIVLEEREPHLSITPGFSDRQKHMVAYSIYMPLFDDVGRIPHLVVGSYVELLSQTPLADRRQNRR